MTDPELLPCPFCGGEPERIDFGPGDAENEGGSCIACKQCQSSGPVEFGRKENFISNWNRRAALSQQRAVPEVTDEMVEIVGKQLWRYWGDVKGAAARTYRNKTRKALEDALAAALRAVREARNG